MALVIVMAAYTGVVGAQETTPEPTSVAPVISEPTSTPTPESTTVAPTTTPTPTPTPALTSTPTQTSTPTPTQTISIPTETAPAPTSVASAQGMNVNFNPTQGAPGTQVIATGSGWGAQARDTMEAIWGSTTGPVVGTGKIQSDGTFILNFTVPKDATPGTYQIWFQAPRMGGAALPAQMQGFTVTPPTSTPTPTPTSSPTVTPPPPPPPIPAPAPTPTSLTVDKVWTMDGNNADKTIFNPGDAIRFGIIVKNDGSSTAKGIFSLQVTGPKNIVQVGETPMDFVPGSITFGVGWNPGIIPVDAQAGTYTLTVTVNYNGQSSSKQSQFTVQAKPTVTVPAAPSGLSVGAIDSNNIRLNWQDNSNNEAGFEISNGDTSVKVGANTNSYTWGGLTPGKYMCFQIRSYNAAGSSAWTPYACTTTTQPAPAPIAPPPTTPTPTFLTIPVAFDSINYINWYGNTEFAYQNRYTSLYYDTQGLHSGIDFIAPYGTPIKSVINRNGVVVSINNKGLAGCKCDYRTGPGNVLIDYGDFLVLYGHTQVSNLPEKVKLGAEILPNDDIAYVGSDGNLIHLHLEVIRKNPPGSSRPGDIRTNPVPFFSSTALGQLKQKAEGIGATFHPIPGNKWQTPEDQPDITPGGPILVP